MRGTEQSARTYLLHHLVVVTLCLFLHVSIGDERWTDLLVTIGTELLLERAQCIELRIKGSLHLQLIVDKEVNILLHGLLVNDTFRIVLIVRIFKLRTTDRLSVDYHDRRVVGLSHSAQT